ncbi:uncharacterized protein LOC124448598 isoform X2 [Xenia sp. Carnegie-2017]|uniref:uncharacterized protein LOC124448598 isoform X2 n=1 Tax=Xenia sp. Carnegie-2017 TaxID=2897299 RepID=UPI001F03A9C5|nr:uncharacterized protein LOC124448598 isoform X2 [Xenia sp. Carnegie-2017]
MSTMAESTSSSSSEGNELNEMSEQAQPVLVTFDDVSTAQSRIQDSVPQTPCEYSKMSDALGMEVYFKKDYLLPTGSFKERGVRNALETLFDDQKRKGVIAASDGNHAFALSYHGQQLGIPVTVVMPKNTPINKIASCKKYGATVHELGTNLIESENFALEMAATKELQYINGCDDPSIIAGAGTMGLEIMQQVNDVDAVIIPVGGGGLIAGVAVAVKELSPKTLVIGVESEQCASFTEAKNKGELVKIDANKEITLADGLCVSKVGINAFHTAKPHIDRMITVHEDYIALAVLRLLEEEKVTIEGAGAVGLAVCLTEQVPELKEKKVVIALCGRNIDSIVLGRCLDRGLAADGRLVRFVVTVSDRPGAIADVTQLVASVGADVKDIFYERAWLFSSVFSVQVKIVARVRDRNHGKKLKEALISDYSDEAVIWPSFDNGSGDRESSLYQSDKDDNDVDIADKLSGERPKKNDNEVHFTAELSRKRPKSQSQEWKYIGESAKHKKMFSKMTQFWPNGEFCKIVGDVRVIFSNEFCIGKGSDGSRVFLGLKLDGYGKAVKRIFRDNCIDSAHQEKEILSKFNAKQSKYVVNYYSLDEGTGTEYVYLILDLCEDSLKNFVKSSTLQDLKKALPEIVKNILKGLADLHSGQEAILHRDLKPSNVLLDSKGNFLIADFGISQILKNETNTYESKANKGTEYWIAPESYCEVEDSIDKGRYKKESDVYNAGLVAYYVATKGKHPFGTKRHRLDNMLNGDPVGFKELKDESLKDLLSWMLNLKPEDRPSANMALKHPFLMSDDEKFDLLCNVGNELPTTTNHTQSSVAKQLDSENSEWKSKIDREVYDFLRKDKVHGKIYNYGPLLTECLRLIRNIGQHWYDRPRPRPQTFYKIGDHKAFFIKKFPNLPVWVHAAVRSNEEFKTIQNSRTSLMKANHVNEQFKEKRTCLKERQ